MNTNLKACCVYGNEWFLSAPQYATFPRNIAFPVCISVSPTKNINVKIIINFLFCNRLNNIISFRCIDQSFSFFTLLMSGRLILFVSEYLVLCQEFIIIAYDRRRDYCCIKFCFQLQNWETIMTNFITCVVVCTF